MQEVWKPVVGYEGLYEVSNLGRVYSLPKKWIRNKGANRSHNGKFLSVGLSSKGYPRVLLSRDGKCKIREIHQLVAEAFLDHRPCGYKIVVDHIDNNKLNNAVTNLQLISQRQNASKEVRGTSKYVGVSYDKARSKWSACISFNKKVLKLGRFNTEYEAHIAYQTKLNEIENGK